MNDFLKYAKTSDIVLAYRVYALLTNGGQAHASLTAVVHYLDEEAERRAKFERDVEQRLDILERSQRDVITSVMELERLAKLEDPRCADGNTVHDFQGERACPACGCSPKLASKNLPPYNERVLFFVPSESNGYRWKVGERVLDGYHEPGKIWRDDEELKLYTAEQVTHWMPMPGDPE